LATSDKGKRFLSHIIWDRIKIKWFDSTNGAFRQQKKLNDYFENKGVINNNGLSIDSTTELLEHNMNPDYFNVNASNQLSPVLELKGIKTNNF
jgi:hypothetical protein